MAFMAAGAGVAAGESCSRNEFRCWRWGERGCAMAEIGTVPLGLRGERQQLACGLVEPSVSTRCRGVEAIRRHDVWALDGAVAIGARTRNRTMRPRWQAGHSHREAPVSLS